MRINTTTTMLLVCLVLVAGIGSVAIWEQSRAHAQAPIRPVPILTPQEASCEKITPQNQGHCVGPETKQKSENCEFHLDKIDGDLNKIAKTELLEVAQIRAVSAKISLLAYRTCKKH